MNEELSGSTLYPIDRLWQRSIWVCGAGRSGTSILSSLVASHLNVEYSFDPPVVHWLLALQDRIDIDAFDQLLQIYLYRDVFRGALSGRQLNFNRNDISFARKFKTDAELDHRLSNILDEWMIPAEEELFSLCIKVTDATFRLDSLQRSFPTMSFLGIVRNPYDAVNSIHKKKWFARGRSNSHIKYETLPFHYDPVLGAIPCWLAEEDIEFWLDANDWERASFYYIRATHALLEKSDNVSIVNYDWFVNHPVELELQLQDSYGLIETSFTQKILESIKPKRYSRNILEGSVSDEIKVELENLGSIISKVNYSFCSGQ